MNSKQRKLKKKRIRKEKLKREKLEKKRKDRLPSITINNKEVILDDNYKKVDINIQEIDKLNLLKNKSFNEFSEIISSLLENLGFNNIESNNEFIYADFNNKFENYKYLFYIVDSSDKEIFEVVDFLLKELQKNNHITNLIFIIRDSKKKSLTNHSKLKNLKLDIKKWDIKEKIIPFIEEYIPKIWNNYDVLFQKYVESFSENLNESASIIDILKITFKDEKELSKMIDFFIEPKLSTLIDKTDSEFSRLGREVSIKDLLNSQSYVIQGQVGSGKTILLKNIGKKMLDKNINKSKENNMPIFIDESDFKLNKKLVPIEDIIIKKIESLNSTIEKISKNYKVTLLIDSIDSFEVNKRKEILENLDTFCFNYKVKFVVMTRNIHHLFEKYKINKSKYVKIKINNFNLEQVNKYLTRFFDFSDKNLSENLYNSLISSKIFNRLPMTPLTLSVISIMYTEKQYEIPATLTDIYDHFNNFLLGKSVLKTNLDFLDIRMKERILSLYALEIMNIGKNYSLEEFESFIKGFIMNRVDHIKPNLIPEIIDSLTTGTGILIKDKDNNVRFAHNYFMEYYTSIEIFNYKKELEATLIDKFNEFNWQNTAIFYAGRTKDMPRFLENVVNKIKTYNELSHLFISQTGLGYLLQALWMTKIEERKVALEYALELNIRLYEQLIASANDKTSFFSKIKKEILQEIAIITFFMDFDSITLKDIFIRIYDELFNNITHINDSDLYKLLITSFILGNEKNNKIKYLEKLIKTSKLINNPKFTFLTKMNVDLLPLSIKTIKGGKIIKSQKTINQLLNQKMKEYNNAIKFYLEQPIEVLALTRFNTIHSYKPVEIYTEGITDVIIIKKAFKILTNNLIPYFRISSAGDKKTGSADTLKKYLQALPNLYKNDSKNTNKIFIGIFDNDGEGIRRFNELKSSKDASGDKFYLEKSSILLEYNDKEYPDFKMFALRLPIPEEKNKYKKDTQENNYFAIEHYFSEEYLEKNNMLEAVNDIEDIYKIKSKKSAKKEFADNINKESNKEIFEDFKVLFDYIDQITGEKTIYHEEVLLLEE